MKIPPLPARTPAEPRVQSGPFGRLAVLLVLYYGREPLRVREIAELLGWAESTTRNYLNDAERLEFAERTPDGWMLTRAGAGVVRCGLLDYLFAEGGGA